MGIATYLRPAATGREVVVAARPDSLMWYVENGLPLHNAEDDAPAAVDLVAASPEEERSFLDESLTDIQAARRYDLVQTIRAYRDSQFRPAVLRAYSSAARSAVVHEVALTPHISSRFLIPSKQTM